MFQLLRVGWGFALAGLLAPLLAQPAGPPLVLRHATVIDGTGAPPKPGQTLVLREGRIAVMGPDAAVPTPNGSVVLNLEGRFVMPGLIEGHGHLLNHGDARLGRALRGGITTLRSMADDGGYIQEVNAALASGELEGPMIRFAALVAGPRFFAEQRGRVQLITPDRYALGEAPWALRMEEEMDLAALVGKAKACGATGLKLYMHLAPPLLARISEEAHRQGLKVWAHSTMGGDVEDVAKAGVDGLTHAEGLLFPADWDLRRHGSEAMEGHHLGTPRLERILDTLKAKGTSLDPTFSVALDARWVRGRSLPDLAARIRWLGEVVRLAHRKGIPITAGTDMELPAKDGELPALHRELEHLVTLAGLTPLEALTAATLNNARALGIEATHGTVEQGKVADLLVLARDPSKDITHTRSILTVIQRGRIITALSNRRTP